MPPAPPVLTTERVVVRMAAEADVPAVVLYWSEEREFHRPSGPRRDPPYYTDAHWRGQVATAAEAFAAERGLLLFAFDRNDPGLVLGHVSLGNVVRGAFQACHVGYALRRSAEGTGLMQEALRAVLPWAFGEWRLHRVMANHLPENVRSARLPSASASPARGWGATTSSSTAAGGTTSSTASWTRRTGRRRIVSK